jgi:hypothetical protein
MSDDLVKRLREVSLEKHQEAWARSDGGQDLTIGAMLADEAADRIQELEAKLAKAVELVEEAYSEGFAEGYDGGWIGGDYRKPWKKSALFNTLAELKGESE